MTLSQSRKPPSTDLLLIRHHTFTPTGVDFVGPLEGLQPPIFWLWSSPNHEPRDNLDAHNYQFSSIICV